MPRAATLALFLLPMTGCTAQLRPPSLADQTRADRQWPGTTLVDLERGQQIYIGHCSSCHQLYRPESHPADKWSGFVKEMMGRAKLQPAEGEDVIRYLVTAAEGQQASARLEATHALPTNLAGVVAPGGSTAP